MSKDKTTYELVVKKQRIEVSKEVYRAYYECRDREVYLDKVHKKHNESLEALQESGFSIEWNSSLISKDSAEDKAIINIMIEKMKASLELLEPEELALIKEIYMKGLAEREVARKRAIPVQTINDRKKAILNKLYWILKK